MPDSRDEIATLRTALEAEVSRGLEIERRLDHANQEFEEFVSRAGHNLRESLRDVAAYSALMEEKYSGAADPEAGIFLDRIREGAANMQSLLTAMVDFWATATGERQCIRTDMDAVLVQVLLYADKQMAERSAMVTCDPLPPVQGDFGLLTTVVHHLIRNAIEYCGTPPRIHVSGRRVDLECVFSVQDNGPGIDPAFQGRLFRVFQRLHGREYPGNGLGLAFCKKAIEWHGGRIWLERAPGSGSTFSFTLPAAE